MGGKASKEEPKEEVKPAPVKPQFNRPADGAVGGLTLARSESSPDHGLSFDDSFLTDSSRKRFDLSLEADRPKTATYADRRRHRKLFEPVDLKHTVIKTKKNSAILVAAIDFGTTYSGYAYSFIENPEEILTNYWEMTTIKTPTVVLMDDEKRFHSFGDEARRKYEELMKTKEHRNWYLFEKFKMKLFVKEGPLEKDMEIEDILDKPMKASDVFTEAIRYIRNHLLGVLNDSKRKEQVMIEKETDIHWVLTVPAIWNDLSKKFMREAANNV